MKNLKKIHIIALLMLSLTGCKNSPSIKENNIKGIYYFDDKISVIQPCNDNRIYWLKGKDDEMNYLKSAVMRRSNSTKQKPVYVELKAINLGYQRNKPSNTYDESMYVTKLIMVDSVENHKSCKQLPIQ